MRTRPWLAGAPVAPLAVLFALNAVDELDSAAFSVLTPEIKADFGLSIAGVATIAAAIVPLTVLLQLAVAYAADRRPRTRIAAAGALVWAGFAAATGFAGSVLSLSLMRIGSSLGKSANATHESLLADWYGPALRARVFSTHALASPVGLIVGPLAAGLLADAIGWRAPFVILAVPTVVVALWALRLHDPVRGEVDRLDAGADAAVAAVTEDPPGLAETFRALAKLRTARWIYASLVFMTAGSIGVGTFFGLYYDEVFGVRAAGRGVIAAAVQPAGIVGLLVVIALGDRLARRPAMTLLAVGVTSAASAVALLVIAVAPALPIAIAGQVLHILLSALILPGLLSVASLVVPARMRSVGFATASVWSLLGLAVLPFVGAAGDRFGLRLAMASFVPLLLVGSACLLYGARFVAEDVQRTAQAGRAAAEERHRRIEGDPQILIVRGLTVVRGGTTILRALDLTVRDGEAVALLGTNGAGKSTLLDALAGLLPVADGAVLFDGHDVTDADPRRRVALGLAGAPAGRGVFADLTVAENLAIAATAREDALDLFPELVARLDVRAGDLSGGEQQMLTLALALLTGPKLLLIDEFTLGLSEAVVARLVEAVRAINARGTTIVVVDQSPEVAARVATRAVYLDRGVVVHDGTFAALRRNRVVRAALLPSNRTRPRATTNVPATTPALAVDDISVCFGGVHALTGVSLAVAPREFVGLVGGNGAGKSTLLDVICGLTHPDTGTVHLDGVDVTRWSPQQRARAGLARSFQDGLLWPALPLIDAVAVALDQRWEALAADDTLADDFTAAEADEYVRVLARTALDGVGLAARATTPVGALSTGLRRAASIAIATAGAPTIVLLDEPAAGLAHAELPALGELLEALPDRVGCAVVLVEHDLALVDRLCARTITLAAGELVAR